jgi:hypothetical protein
MLRAAPDLSQVRSLAPTPPMGWNSWDSFATTINEEQARSVAQIMATRLLPHGYDIFTIDAQWSESGANGFNYRKGAALALDEFGRLLPAANRFPSSANRAGFKPLADYIHGLGLKFGVHIMRGVPRQRNRRSARFVAAHGFADGPRGILAAGVGSRRGPVSALAPKRLDLFACTKCQSRPLRIDLTRTQDG